VIQAAVLEEYKEKFLMDLWLGSPSSCFAEVIGLLIIYGTNKPVFFRGRAAMEIIKELFTPSPQVSQDVLPGWHYTAKAVLEQITALWAMHDALPKAVPSSGTPISAIPDSRPALWTEAIEAFRNVIPMSFAQP